MTTVAELQPGDRMTMHGLFDDGPTAGTFVQQAQHPIWAALQLVIWKMDDGTWSHDALDARQELHGEIDRPATEGERRDRLRRALLTGP